MVNETFFSILIKISFVFLVIASFFKTQICGNKCKPRIYIWLINYLQYGQRKPICVKDKLSWKLIKSKIATLTQLWLIAPHSLVNTKNYLIGIKFFHSFKKFELFCLIQKNMHCMSLFNQCANSDKYDTDEKLLFFENFDFWSLGVYE